MRARFVLLPGFGLLLAGLVATGCTPGSSQSSGVPDSTTVRQTAPPQDTTRTGPVRSAAPSPDAPRSVDERLRDATVEARITQALVLHRPLRGFDFVPEVVRGHVVLQGDVDTRAQYRRAERIARSVEGVASLTNRVTVDGHPVSTDDSSSSSSTGEQERTYYTVRQGDTLWDIAREHGVSVGQIKALNAQSVTSLQPGERIRVR